MKNKYTLDSLDSLFGTFLLKEDESINLVIPIEFINSEIKEGSIVNVELLNPGYLIELLEDDTEEMKEKVSSLLEKLKNKQ